MPPVPISELDDLMGRAADGDREALDPLFALVWPVVHRVCGRMVPDDAEEVAQSAMIKLFSHAHRYDRERAALPWVVGIAAFEARTHRRRAQRHAAREVDPEALAAVATPSHEATVEARMLLDDVQDVLGELSPLDRETILETLNPQRQATDATFRKRRQRAFRRFFRRWSLRHDDP